MKKNLKILFYVLSVFFISCLSSQSAWAESGKKIPLRGEWREIERSTSSCIPISVYLIDRTLSIQCSTQRSDITIRILKDEKVFYEETISAAVINCVTVDLNEFDSTIYSIELKNQWGDCLCGVFEVNN